MGNLTTGIIGFLIGWIGIFLGMIFSVFTKAKGRRTKGSVLGLLGGFTLGVVCFDLLPEAFEAGSLFTALVGIVTGLILSVILDGKLEYDGISIMNCQCNSYFKTAIFMAIGIGIHNLPSGVALGSLIADSVENGLHLAIALVLHGIPEGLTLGIFLRECNASKWKLILISICTSVPMGMGAILGGFLKSPVTICLSLAFAGAMILYITLRETLPSASDTWKGRTTTIGNVLGIIIGMLMVSFFQ